MDRVSLDKFLLFNESFDQQGKAIHNPKEHTEHLLVTDGENFLDIDYNGNAVELVNQVYESTFNDVTGDDIVLIDQLTGSEPVYEIDARGTGTLRYDGSEDSFEWNIDPASAAGFLSVAGGEILVSDDMTVREETVSDMYGELRMAPVSQRKDVLEFGMATESDVDEYNTRDFVDTEITGLTEDLEDVLDQIPGYTSSLGLPVTATYSDGHTEGEVFLGPLIGERSVKFLDRQMKENRFSKEASKSYNIPSIASFTRKVAEAEGEEVLPTIEFTNVEGYPRSVPSASMAYLPEEDRLVNASYGTVQELAMEDEMFKGGYKEDNQPIIRPIKINVKNIGNQLEDRQNIEDPDLNMFQ